ncbi:MAG: hypothetical protein Q8P07_04770 [bacterium]|nr:hypothetical protein [bacterium]
MDYLPSKKFVMPVVSMLVVIFAGYFVRLIWTSPAKIAEIPQKNSVNGADYAKALAEANADTDNDNLMNWEEILWGTDILKADTDGDGTSDGDEIKAGRDPLVAGKETANPPSALSGGGKWTDALQKPEAVAVLSDGSTETLNYTQQFAAKFANSYFALKGAAGGEALTDKTKGALAQGMANEVTKSAASYADVYTEKDLKISQFAGVKTYLSDLSDAFERNFQNVTEMEVPFVTAMAKSGDFSQAGKLDVNITAYKKMAEYLKNAEVPSAYAKTHLTILNIMNNTAIAVEMLKQTKEDPLLAAVGIQFYYNQTGRSQQFFVDLFKQTLADGIDFADGQQGTFFNKYFVKQN